MSENPELNPEPPEVEKPKRTKKILLVIAGVLVACCLGAGILAISSNSDSGEVTEQQAAVDEEVAVESANVDEKPDKSSGDVEVNEQDAEEVQQDAEESQQQEGTQEEAVVSEPEPTETIPPTAVPTETPQPTPTPLPEGLSRAVPYAPGEIVSSDSWEVQVLQMVRGDEAWQKISTANQFNDPPPEGKEYLLVNVRAKNISAAEEALRISYADFDATGKENILYRYGYAVVPEPELEGELFSGGETEGWIAYQIGEGEEDLILVLDELWSFGEDENRYIALEEGASITVDPGLFDLGATSIGLTRQEPAPIGETVATDEFEITLNEVIRGDEVYNMLLEANQFNDPPGDDMTYVAAKIHARRIGTGDRALEISYGRFDPTGSENVLYNLPSVVGPDDELGAYLFPGGETEGWVVIEVPADEENLMLAYEPWFTLDDEDLRFLAIDENASIEVPEELNTSTENELGKEFDNPAPLGETVATGSYDFTVMDVVRGNEALALVQQENTYNDPPDEGMEYVAVKMKVRRTNPSDDWISISGYAFELTGDNAVIYDIPSVVDPEPRLDVRLYPDGEYEGWSIYQASEGETGLVLIYDTLFGIGERYFALE